jgi:hypothetical protein
MSYTLFLDDISGNRLTELPIISLVYSRYENNYGVMTLKVPAVFKRSALQVDAR